MAASNFENVDNPTEYCGIVGVSVFGVFSRPLSIMRNYGGTYLEFKVFLDGRVIIEMRRPLANEVLHCALDLLGLALMLLPLACGLVRNLWFNTKLELGLFAFPRRFRLRTMPKSRL